jgi:hypothetical protein
MGYASHAEVEQRRQADDLRTLERIVSELKAALTPVAQQVMAGGGGGGYGSGTPKDLVYALTPGGGIAARTGAGPYTLGSASVTLFDKTAGTLTLLAATATCYNASTTAVAGSTIIGMIERADGTGEYDVVMESC